jgi:hypothetical protein
MKKLLLIFCFFSITNLAFTQTKSIVEKNRYFITMYNLNANNFMFTQDLLEKFTNASYIEFNASDSAFTVLTYSLLDKKVVSGKMLKNYVPIKYFILDGEPIDPFPVYTNTGDQDQDAINYQKQKSDWINKYPAEYKKMVENLKK